MSGFVYVGLTAPLLSLPRAPPARPVALSTVVEQLVSAVDESLATAVSCPEPEAAGEQLAVEIPVFGKAYEDRMLQRPIDDRGTRVVCLSGRHCECVQMARFPPHNCPELGFHGAAALNGYCVLCLRVQVAKAYYVSTMTSSGRTQTMRNVIESPGEYTRECCFLPTASNRFLTDPVVMHQRNVGVAPARPRARAPARPRA